MFDRFYRVDAARTGGERHHGLALAIVMAIARMHSGRVMANSAESRTSIGLIVLTS
jgi:two-component system heavy metal sensor histidine kinase CusS